MQSSQLLSLINQLLIKTIKKVAGDRVALIDSAPSTSKRLKEVLERRGLLKDTNGHNGKVTGKLNVYVSDLPRNFLKIGEQFLGQKIDRIETVTI